MIVLLFQHQYSSRNWFQPLGSFLGIKFSVHRKPPTNDVLEAEFNKMAKNNLHVLNYNALTEQIDMSERQIQVWLRIRKSYGLFDALIDIKVQEKPFSGKPTKMGKFCETGWRCLYYSGLTLYGIWSLWDKSWTWNILECW